MNRLFLSLCLAATLHAAEDAADLLDQAIRSPGSYSQICDLPTLKQSPELPLFGISQPTEYEFSAGTLSNLRTNRAAVIQELQSRLAAMSWDKTPERREYKTEDNTAKAGDDTEASDELVVIDTGLDTHAFSDTMLKIVLDLNATECLPELLRLEADLNRRILANAKDPKANPLPKVQVDIGGIIADSKYADFLFSTDEPPPEVAKAIQEEQERVVAQVVQRDILSSILLLLRQEKFKPMLQSEFEKKFEKSVRAQGEGEDLANIKSAADIPADETNYIAWDEVMGAPYYPGWTPAHLPFSEETREKIVDLARKFLKSVPPESRLGAKGMLPQPMYR